MLKVRFQRVHCLLVIHASIVDGDIILCADIFVYPVHSPEKHRWQRCLESQCTSIEWFQAIALIIERCHCVVHSTVYKLTKQTRCHSWHHTVRIGARTRAYCFIVHCYTLPGIDCLRLELAYLTNRGLAYHQYI